MLLLKKIFKKEKKPLMICVGYTPHKEKTWGGGGGDRDPWRSPQRKASLCFFFKTSLTRASIKPARRDRKEPAPASVCVCSACHIAVDIRMEMEKRTGHVVFSFTSCAPHPSVRTGGTVCSTAVALVSVSSLSFVCSGTRFSPVFKKQTPQNKGSVERELM